MDDYTPTMEWIPLIHSDQEKAWIERQKATENAILNAFAIHTDMIEAPKEHTPEQKALVRGMDVCGEVARLYKRRGNPPKWVKLVADEHGKQQWVEDTDHDIDKANRAHRRAIRMKMHMTTQPDQYACGTCGLAFVAPTAKRCQCKPARTMETQAMLEQAQKLAAKMRDGQYHAIEEVA